MNGLNCFKFKKLEKRLFFNFQWGEIHLVCISYFLKTHTKKIKFAVVCQCFSQENMDFSLKQFMLYDHDFQPLWLKAS